jgi:hypothetical protein
MMRCFHLRLVLIYQIFQRRLMREQQLLGGIRRRPCRTRTASRRQFPDTASRTVDFTLLDELLPTPLHEIVPPKCRGAAW